MSLHNSSDSLQTLSGVLEDFFAFARKALQAGADLSNAQSESVDPQDHEKVISGLDAVIAQVDSLIETYDLDDQNLYLFGHALHDQASALKCRFQLLEDISDLNRCIFALGCVLHFCDPSDLQHLYNLFMNQMHALMMHHIATDDRNDVDRTIETIEWLLASPHCTRPERTYVATFLAYELDFRVESEGQEEDVRRVLKFCDDILPSAERESLWHLLQLRTTSLASLSRFGRRVIDPHQALCLLRKDHDAILSDEAPSITKELVSQAVDIFLRLELVDAVITVDRDLAEEVEQELYTRCRPRLVKGSREVHLPEPYLSSVADLDVLIKAFKQWQLSYPPESCHAPHREVSTLLLVLFLYYGYQLSHQPQYLRESLAIRSSSQLSPLGTYCLDMVLLREAQDDLNPIDVGRRFEEAVKVHGTCDCSPSIHVNSLARLGGRQELQLVASMSYFSEGFGTGDAGVVDVGRPGMGLMSSSIGGTEKKVQSLSALAGFHHAQWRKSGDVEELKKAVKLLQQAVDGIQDDDQSREAWLARCDWAQVLLELCSVGQASPLEKLRLAFDYIRIFVTDKIHLAHSPRLAFVSNWFHYLPFVWKFEGFLDHVPEMCELALSLLEEQLWAVSGPRSSIDGRWPTHSLHIDAAFFSLFMYHRPDGTKVKRSLLPITRAIEILEAGQSTVWNQIARLRPPIDKLASVNPTLASRFEELSSTLKNHLVSPEPAPDPLGAQGWRVYQDRTQIIEEIRALPGFESFLKLKSPKEFENAGLDGPVVILLPHIAQCVAIVLFVRNYTIVNLPITLNTIEGMHHTLQILAKTRGESSENAGDVNSPSGSDDEAHSLDPDSEDSTQVRSLRRKGPPEPQMNLVLETLWKEVAELIVDRITSFTMGKKGDLAAIASEKPKMWYRHRIWWMCLGEFSFIPIHAAGIYRGPSPISVSDFFVSSYTPSLGALIDAGRRPKAQSLKVLAAIQPNPGNGWCRLGQAANELQEIVKKVPKDCLLHLGSSSEPDFDGARTTVKNVIDKLSEASLLHLACHGTQDKTDPLRSGFILANGERLTVEELMRLHLPNAHTAILSACHTASNDAGQPDESINLASAMLSVGFRSIVATKWPMYDSDGPALARAVYDAYFPEETEAIKETPSASSSIDKDEYHSRPAFNYTEESGKKAVTISPPPIWSTLGGKTKPREDEPPTVIKYLPSLIPRTVVRSELDVFGKAVFDEIFGSPLNGVSLAHVVDEFARNLRENHKAPPSRWATFVHIGI